MLTLHQDKLRFQFPDVHPEASCGISFERTLRIPDDNQTYPLPPKLGPHFPLRVIDDYADQVPSEWARHGGVFLPLYQFEALWLNFHAQPARIPYPCAIKVATGKVNALTGEPWCPGLHQDPQDYLVVPSQHWLDGYKVAKGLVRQFVATLRGAGHSAESQITGQSEIGGLQLAVYPMKRDHYAHYRDERERMLDIRFCRRASSESVEKEVELAPGGLIRQEVYADRHGFDAWDQHQVSRCFVHLLNTEAYQAVTGERPPASPFSARDYAKAGLPWFHYYSDEAALDGSESLAKLNSLAAMTATETGKPMPGNEPLGPLPVQSLGKQVVRDGDF